MTPTIAGWGHIVYSADHVSIGIGILVGVGVASCLHSISLMNRWILLKLTQIYHGVEGNMLIRFW